MSRRQALIELIFAGALWGFGFVAAVWALRAFTPAETLLWRFLLAAVAGEFLWRFLLRPRGRAFFGADAQADLRRSAPGGVLLAAMLLPQTIGLQSTTAAKSGFLTALYVIFVPLITHFILRRPVKKPVFFYAAIALGGAFVLMGADLSDLNHGDLWTVLCALLAALHILYIDRISNRIRDPFRFNAYQTLFCLLSILPFLALQPRITWFSADPLAWAGVGFLAVASTIVGFTIQVRTQRVLDSTTASMLFLLESPFALAAGVVFLGEKFTAPQALGASLILLASLLTISSSAPSGSTRKLPR
ncbi:MAG: DMT family transporter [Bdellovibrionaceae bacterium]|nr:DMT family transporter [Pseudobdellovibrionaceae bacterium]